MHIACVICSDLSTPNDYIYATPCGHVFHYICLLQWLENSKTCPQCRAKVSSRSLMRLYVNVATSQGTGVDVTFLRKFTHELDSLLFSWKHGEIIDENKALRKKVKKLKLANSQYVQNSHMLQEEILGLKNKMKNLEHVQIAVNGSRQQVEEIIRNENCVESLALIAATLKKSLIDTDSEKKELQYELEKTQNELSQHKRNMTEMKCEYEDKQRQLESLKLNYEFALLQAKATKDVANDSLNDSIRRITLESPVNHNQTPVLSGCKGDIVDLNVSIISNAPPCSGSSQYSAFSLFKNKHQPIPLKTIHIGADFKDSDVTYDDLGGSGEEDIYPSQRRKRPRYDIS